MEVEFVVSPHVLNGDVDAIFKDSRYNVVTARNLNWVYRPVIKVFIAPADGKDAMSVGAILDHVESTWTDWNPFADVVNRYTGSFPRSTIIGWFSRASIENVTSMPYAPIVFKRQNGFWVRVGVTSLTIK